MIAIKLFFKVTENIYSQRYILISSHFFFRLGKAICKTDCVMFAGLEHLRWCMIKGHLVDSSELSEVVCRPSLPWSTAVDALTSTFQATPSWEHTYKATASLLMCHKAGVPEVSTGRPNICRRSQVACRLQVIPLTHRCRYCHRKGFSLQSEAVDITNIH